ncbi:Membrane associated serine protease, rhomboid family [Cognatiyoonia koreensis]|uniref:Membrane associated serine protease, rhomboid family n=1 Tax=Cognatiyoonia koreensis TaxID=364200 RepID=A0A1I0RSD3_9RHOB|nr:rhomboid family intramembrane serine protease [Cognatiyoonia koreensis]SEW44195.1 Membrane associated serine protease, rhomboid family [Cognatiyoonia koreensis]
MASVKYSRQIVIALIVICTAIEVSLLLADFGLVGSGRLRQTVYEYAGFWPGLLRTWQPNYDAQPYLMFVTYGFLHSGIAHLLINMVTLWSLSGAVIRRVGGRGFVLLYGFSIVAGAIGYAFLNTTPVPMVGASGALFGLAGGLLAWSYVDRYTAQQGLWPVAQAIVLLIGLNLVLWWAMDGHLAWQTHFGGFLGGWMIATVIDPRPRERKT